MSEKIKKIHAYRFRSALNATGLYAALDYFGSLSLSGQSKQGLFSSFQCIGGLVNKNLTMAQKELLLWHWKLGIGMQRLQVMTCNHTFEDPFGRSQVHPPIIQAKFASTSSCAIPRCQSCELDRARVRSPKVKKIQSNINSEGAIRCNKLDIRDFVSTDQFVCRTPVRLSSGYGREVTNSQFNGGTIYNDAASGLIWVENQVSLGTSETIMGKERFEQWLYDIACVEVKHYHGDNGIFSSEAYRKMCSEKMQAQSFSGVGTQHPNSKAKRAIQMIM